MKCIRKTGFVLGNNNGETIVEVIVAFALLSIMLVLFANGIAWATRSEVNATKSRIGADKAMKNVQDDIAAGGWVSHINTYPQIKGYLDDRVIRITYTYTIDGQTYTYVVYETY